MKALSKLLDLNIQRFTTVLFKNLWSSLTLRSRCSSNAIPPVTSYLWCSGESNQLLRKSVTRLVRSSVIPLIRSSANHDMNCIGNNLQWMPFTQVKYWNSGIIQRRHFAKKTNYPPLNEDDLEETFTRGSGPGGQSVNKTTNCAIVKHIPTGIVVKNHESRSLDTNRKNAKKKLQEKLDIFYNGDDSFVMKERANSTQNKRDRKKKTNQKLVKLRAFKEREGLS